jgi:copper oxidase (laccase) domain-containing protein
MSYQATESQYRFGPHTVALFGHQPSILDNKERSINQAISLSALPDQIAQVIVASTASEHHHKEVIEASYGKITYADGVILRQPSTAAIIQTADCPAVVLYNEKNGAVGLIHAGRPAVTPTIEKSSVIEYALAALCDDQNRDYIHTLVLGNICGDCFVHDYPNAQHLVEPFDVYPKEVFKDRSKGALDLHQVIVHQLTEEGVKEDTIRHEGDCTLEHDHLSSHRRGDNTRNTIILVSG